MLLLRIIVCVVGLTKSVLTTDLKKRGPLIPSVQPSLDVNVLLHF